MNLLLPEIGARIGTGKRFNEYLRNYSTVDHPQFLLYFSFQRQEIESRNRRMVSLQVRSKNRKIIVTQCYLTLLILIP